MLTAPLAALSVTLLSLFPIVNPIGNLPVFAALTTGDAKSVRQRQALRTSIYVAIVLLVAALAGRPILHALGISIGALEVAGGVIVAHLALKMVAGNQRSLAPSADHAKDPGGDIAFTPMTIPLLSGPGAIGAVIALTTRAKGASAVAGIAAGIVALAVVVLVVLSFGDRLLVRLGHEGTDALTRLFGFLTLAIAVELLTHGLLALAPALRG
jgi:multiple antibiotic resistance protein